MSRRPASSGQRSTSAGNSARLLSLVTAGEMTIIVLILCRLFVPAEGVEQGNTLWIACSWLVLGAVCLWMKARSGTGLSVSFGVADGAVGLLIGGQLISAACVLLGTGDKRAALNCLWEWLSLGVTWGLLKGVIHKTTFQRLLTSVLLISVIALSVLGLWQHVVWYPQQSRDLTDLFRLHDARISGQTLSASEQARLNTLRSQWGSDVLMMEEGGRQMLLARTRDSREPIGRFALANTFAALLLLGWFLSADLLRQLISSRQNRMRLLFGIVAFGLVTICLLLTKSRTAVVGLILSIGLLVLKFGLQPGPYRKTFLRWGGGGIAAVILLGIAVTLFGGLDREVLSEAPKSLEYRMEYWKATVRMILDHPIWGVGPGNFRQHYYAYKLPGASEEILDPHNMVLESWATGGILSFAGLILLVIPWGLRGWFSPLLPDDANPPSEEKETSTDGLFPAAVLIGMGTFTLILMEEWLFEGFFDQSLCGIAAGWMAILFFGFRKIFPLFQFSFPASLAAATAILIHLLGAGGFGMPAVLQLILILILMTTLPRPASLTIPPQGVMVGSVLLAGMFVGGIWTGLVPVVSSQSLIEQARQESMTYHSAYDAMSRLNRATQTDDLSATPYRDLAQLHFAQWQTQFQDASDLFQLGVEALQQAIARDPRSPKDYRSLSEWWQKRYERTQNRDDAIAALQAAQRAVELYPNDSRMQRQLAIAAQIADEPAIAQQAAGTALQLDDINRQRGHVDKFLTESQRQELLKIQGE